MHIKHNDSSRPSRLKVKLKGVSNAASMFLGGKGVFTPLLPSRPTERKHSELFQLQLWRTSKAAAAESVGDETGQKGVSYSSGFILL